MSMIFPLIYSRYIANTKFRPGSGIYLIEITCYFLANTVLITNSFFGSKAQTKETKIIRLEYSLRNIWWHDALSGGRVQVYTKWVKRPGLAAETLSYFYVCKGILSVHYYHKAGFLLALFLKCFKSDIIWTKMIDYDMYSFFSTLFYLVDWR